jgi:hypothetical protein
MCKSISGEITYLRRDGYEVTIVLAVVFGNRFSGSVPNV